MHSVCTSAASVADKHMLPDLLHGEERKVWGDGGYQGQTDAIKETAPKAQDMTCRRTKFKNYIDEEAKRKNTTKSKVRAKVEHVFRILKRVFGFDKVRYRGIAKTITGCAPASPWSISTCISNAWPRSGRLEARKRPLQRFKSDREPTTPTSPIENPATSSSVRRRRPIKHLRRGSLDGRVRRDRKS